MPDNAAFYSARPIISLAGEDMPSLAAGLLKLIIVENCSGLYRLEATFGNWGNLNNSIGFLYFDKQTLDFGKDVAIKLAAEPIFKGRITGIEATYPQNTPPTITILAEDAFQDLRMTRRTRSFEDISDADLFRKLASDHNLTPNVDVPATNHKLLAQINQSDLAFLRDRARAIEAELWIENNTLNAVSRTKRSQEKLTFTYKQELWEFMVLADLAHQRTSLTVSGWDTEGKTELSHEVKDDALGGELAGGDSGAGILEEAFGERKEQIAHMLPLNSQETQVYAEASFKMRAHRFVVGKGVAEPDERLRVGVSVDLQGLGKLFNGQYYVAEVRTKFDGRLGLRSEFTAERPSLAKVA